MKTLTRLIVLGTVFTLAAGAVRAQHYEFGPPGSWRSHFWRDINNHPPMVRAEGGDWVNEDTVKTARETGSHSTGTPNWTNAPGFEKDVFTFTRIIYKYSTNPRVSTSSSPWGWITDYPDSDLNLSYRVQFLTTIRTDPDGRELKLTDPELFRYPWIYMVEPGRMELRSEEVPILRKYLLNGGVLMVDDFWGQKQWDNFEYWMKQVLPERTWAEVPTNHPIFHCVFDIKRPKNKLQTPNSTLGAESLDPAAPAFGTTWEYYHDDYDNNDNLGRAAHDMHVRTWQDDKGRIMVIATHNCDNGDSWEHEGQESAFFNEFSANRGYPLGINIIYYLMTH